MKSKPVLIKDAITAKGRGVVTMNAHLSDIMETIRYGRPTQRQALYTWESRWEDDAANPINEPFSIADAKVLLAKIIKAYGLPPKKITVEINPKNEGGTTEFNVKTQRCVMTFETAEYLNPSVIIHEGSHAVMNFYNHGENNQHGPEFARLFIDALIRFGGLDKKTLLTTAEEDGICLSDELPDYILQGLKKAGNLPM